MQKNWHMNRQIHKVGASASIDVAATGLGRSICSACVDEIDGALSGGVDLWSTPAGSTARRRPSVRCNAR